MQSRNMHIKDLVLAKVRAFQVSSIFIPWRSECDSKIQIFVFNFLVQTFQEEFGGLLFCCVSFNCMINKVYASAC